MTKKILTMLTIDDLVKFCEQQNFEKFNSNESGYKICVQVPSTFSVESDNQLPEGITKLKIKILHTDKNRNGSFVSKESAEEAMKNTFECVPILAAIHQLSDGSYDFAGHEIDIVENDKGQAEVEYIEKQVGSFTHDAPWFEYDEENDKEYVCAYAGIPNEYTRTVDILNNKDKKTWVSSELSINKFSWNAKEKYLVLEEWYLSGCTLLGTTMDDEEEVKPGMIGAEASIVDFSTENNSVLNNVIESNALDDKNMGNQVQKGGEKPMNKFEELEAKFAAEFDEGESTSEELDDAAWGLVKWGNSHCKRLWCKVTGNELPRRKDMGVKINKTGIKRTEHTDAKGIPFIEEPKIGMEMLIKNGRAVECDRWLKGIKTSHGEGRYALRIRFMGEWYKLIVNATEIKNFLDDMERNKVSRLMIAFKDDGSRHYSVNEELTEILEVDGRKVTELNGKVVFEYT